MTGGCVTFSMRGVLLGLMDRLKTIHEVYAPWCPHCVPPAHDAMKKMSEELGVPLKQYDIDTDAVKEADALVKKYGDWSPDYFIPQIFLEFEDGEVLHIFTGYNEGTDLTKKGFENLFKSKLYADLKAKAPLRIAR